MANRVITAAVSGEKIKMSNRLAGASGSHNAVSLSLTFDSAWDGTTKKIYFFDRDGENPVFRLLTVDLLVDGAYIVPIPSEPLAKSGDMTITIRGVEMDGDTAERIIMSASTNMKVDEAVTPDSDVAPVEPTPTQAEQLQGQIDSLIDEISGIPDSVQAAQNSANAAAGSATAADSARVLAETARTGAEAARDSAQDIVAAFDSHAASLKADFNSNAAAANATIDGKVTIATNAATAAQTAQGLSEGARDASVTAKNEAVTAKTAAETAQGLAQTAKTGADTAKSGAETARTGAESARDAAITAKNDAVTAKNAAQSAQTAAETAKGQAETAKTGAETAATTAGNRALDSEAFGAGTRSGAAVTVGDPAFQNNAKWYKEQAAEIVGGDYPTKTEAQGYVSTHDGSGTAHSALLSNKVDKVAGKGLSTEDYTTAEKTKLAGVATGANNYTHPANHPPSIITQDASNRFVTDTEKSTWNGKANASHTHTKASITDFPASMTPTAHKTSHSVGGADALIDSDIGLTPAVATALGLTGNPQVKDALAKLSGTVSPEQYVWEKFTIGAFVSSNWNDYMLSYESSSNTTRTVRYGDSISYDGEKFIVNNPTTIEVSRTNHTTYSTVLRGKYWVSDYQPLKCYKGTNDGTLGADFSGANHYVRMPSFPVLEELVFLEQVASWFPDAYPADGGVGGYRYIYRGRPRYIDAEIETGQYTGTGTYGSANPNTIAVNSQTIAVIVSVINADEFEGCTSAIFIKGASSASANKPSNSGAGQIRTIYISKFDNTQLKYYSDESVNGVPIQLNRNGYVYRYVLLSLS